MREFRGVELCYRVWVRGFYGELERLFFLVLFLVG